MEKHTIIKQEWMCNRR